MVLRILDEFDDEIKSTFSKQEKAQAVGARFAFILIGERRFLAFILAQVQPSDFLARLPNRGIWVPFGQCW